MLTIFAISRVIILLAAKLVYDLRLWYNREIKGTGTKTVKHKAEWLIIAVCSAPSIIQLAEICKLQWYYSYPHTSALTAFFIWIMFDGLYNILRGYNWFYTGSMDADDAATDKLLRNYGSAGHVAKYVVFAWLIFFYLKYVL